VDHLAAFREAKRHRARRQRARWFVLGSVLIVLSAGTIALPFLTGRAIEPVLALQHADAAVEAARQEGAPQWAPALFATADSLLTAARAERRAQLGRLAPLRNYGPLLLQIEDVRARADFAIETTRSERAAVRTRSQEAIDRVIDTLHDVEKFRDAAALDVGSRRRLQSARVHLGEAELHQEDGDYVTALSIAESAEREALSILDGATRRASRYVDGAEVQRWQGWVEQTISESRRGGGSAIIVFKERNELVLYRGGSVVRRYPVELGRKSLERKLIEGDYATPEGRYRIVSKKQGGETIYHRALLLNYPTEADLARLADAKRRGLVRKDARPGGMIEVHGEGGKGWDWTRGCVAMKNSDIDDLWSRIDVDTPVTIVGGDGHSGTYSRMVRTASKRRQ
jgi:hypothetical protein